MLRPFAISQNPLLTESLTGALVHADDVVDAVETKARGVTPLTRTTGVMVRLPKKGKKCNLMYSVRSATHGSGPGRSPSLQLTPVHRPLEPELGVALVMSVAASDPDRRSANPREELALSSKEMQDQNDMAKLLEDLAQEVD